MNSKHHKTLALIFAKPTPAALEWVRIEALFIAAGAQTIEGDGSRVRKDARQFLEQAGITAKP